MGFKLNIPLPNKGIVVDRPGEYVDQRAMTDCQNIQVINNEVQQRYGGIALGSSLGERIMGMTELESGIYTYLVRVGVTKAEFYSKSSDSWASIANAALTGTTSDIVDFAFPILSGSRIITYTNNKDNIRKYTGTGNDADLGGSPPKAKFLLDFGGYLILADIGGGAYPWRVQWCDTGDIEEWTTGNSGSVNLLEDSLTISGLNRFGNSICVHKESAIYLGQPVDTSEIFRFSRKETGVGTIAHRSIQNLPDGNQIFLARDGIRLFNGYTTALIPAPMNEEIRQSMNPEYLWSADSVLVSDLDEYCVAVPIGSETVPQSIYKYNYRTRQVYKDERTNLSSMALTKRVSDLTWDDIEDSWDTYTSKWDNVIDLALHKAVAFGDTSGNATMRTTASNDSGTAIDSILDTKDFTIDDVAQGARLGRTVRWQTLDVWAKGNSVTVWYSTDSGSTWNKIGKLTLDSDYPADSDPALLYFDVLSEKIRFRFRNQNASESWTLKKYSIEFVPRDVRK